MNIRTTLPLALAVGLLPLVPLGADDKKPEAAPLIVVDAKDKQHRIKTWKFADGTRRLSWLVATEKKEPDRKEDKDDPSAPRARQRPQRNQAAGPEALVFREDASTDYANGVLTFIPLENLRGMDFDAEKKSMTVRVATSDKIDKDVVLTGPTR